MQDFYPPNLIGLIVFLVSLSLLLFFRSPYLTSPTDGEPDLSLFHVGMMLVAIFFTTFFLTNILLFTLRQWLHQGLGEQVNARVSVRRAFLTASGTIALLILQLSQTLNWMTALLLAATILTLEWSWRARRE